MGEGSGTVKGEKKHVKGEGEEKRGRKGGVACIREGKEEGKCTKDVREIKRRRRGSDACREEKENREGEGGKT